MFSNYNYDHFRVDRQEKLDRAEKERMIKEAREERDSRKRKPDQE
jgi:hypothetical protein